MNQSHERRLQALEGKAAAEEPPVCIVQLVGVGEVGKEVMHIWGGGIDIHREAGETEGAFQARARKMCPPRQVLMAR